MNLYISKLGIHNPIQYQLKDALKDLQTAMANTGTAPSSFSYASYINDLDNKISKYVKELQEIQNVVIKTEQRYTDLFSEETAQFNNIDEYGVKPRDGISAKIDQNATYVIDYSDTISGKKD